MVYGAADRAAPYQHRTTETRPPPVARIRHPPKQQDERQSAHGTWLPSFDATTALTPSLRPVETCPVHPVSGRCAGAATPLEIHPIGGPPAEAPKLACVLSRRFRLQTTKAVARP